MSASKNTCLPTGIIGCIDKFAVTYYILTFGRGKSNKAELTFSSDALSSRKNACCLSIMTNQQ